MAGIGLGYGLAKVGEGISSGLLKGTLMNRQMEAAQGKQNQALMLELAKMGQSASQFNTKMGMEDKKLSEQIRHNQGSEALTKANQDVDLEVKALTAAEKSYNMSGDAELANAEYLRFFPKDKQAGRKLTFTPKYLKVEHPEATYFVPPDVLKDFSMIPFDDKVDGFDQAKKLGVIPIKKSGAPMSEGTKATLAQTGAHQKVMEAQGQEKIGLQRAGLTLKKEEAFSGKPKGWKEQKIAAMWDTLTDDEQKRVIGARIDPKELTEKNILDVYGNIMTDSSVRKALQPIAEKIITRTLKEGQGGAEPSVVSKTTPPPVKPDKPGFATFKGKKTPWYFDGKSWSYLSEYE